MTSPIRDLLARSPHLDEDYVLALGAAVYYFLLAEWMAANCCEAMCAGYVNGVANKAQRTSARNIAEKLISLTKKLPACDEQEKLLVAAEDFLGLVKDERNILLHSNPASIQAKTVLHNSKVPKTFTLDALEEYARQSFDCNHTLNHAYHKFLKSLRI